jgi:hypothetical protein
MNQLINIEQAEYVSGICFNATSTYGYCHDLSDPVLETRQEQKSLSVKKRTLYMETTSINPSASSSPFHLHVTQYARLNHLSFVHEIRHRKTVG